MSAPLAALAARLLAAPAPRDDDSADPPQPGRLPFRASVGTPALHDLEREPLGVAGDVPLAEDGLAPDSDEDPNVVCRRYLEAVRAARRGQPSSLDELSTAPGGEPDVGQPVAASSDQRAGAGIEPPGEPAADERQGQLAHLRQRIRDCSDELGVLGNLRRVEPDDRWHARLPDFEQRLLCVLDLCAALGERSPVLPRFDVLAELRAHTSSTPAVDFTRDFARAFVFSCVRGPDAAAAAIVSLLRSPEATWALQLDAFALGSTPSLDLAASKLLDAPAAELQLLGLDIAARRRGLRFADVAPLLRHPDGRLRRAALGLLASLPTDAELTEALRSAIGREVDDVVLAAALRSQLVHEPAVALSVLRARLADDRARTATLAPAARREMVWLLGLAGAKRDGALLEQVVTRDASDVAALGWYGSADHVARLLTLLQRRPPGATDDGETAAAGEDGALVGASGPVGADPLRLAAARALHRITGARLPASGFDEDPYRPTTDPDRWRRWLAQPEHGLEQGVRLRFGEPYRCHATLDELDAVDVPGAAREAAALELAVVTGQPPLDVHTWVARQRAELAARRSALDAACGPAPGATGSFPLRAALGPGNWLGDSFRAR